MSVTRRVDDQVLVAPILVLLVVLFLLQALALG